MTASSTLIDDLVRPLGYAPRAALRFESRRLRLADRRHRLVARQ